MTTLTQLRLEFNHVQVGVGVLYLEYRRGERNAADKMQKENEFRRQLDEGVHRDREVS